MQLVVWSSRYSLYIKKTATITFNSLDTIIVRVATTQVSHGEIFELQISQRLLGFEQEKPAKNTSNNGIYQVTYQPFRFTRFPSCFRSELVGRFTQWLNKNTPPIEGCPMIRWLYRYRSPWRAKRITVYQNILRKNVRKIKSSDTKHSTLTSWEGVMPAKLQFVWLIRWNTTTKRGSKEVPKVFFEWQNVHGISLHLFSPRLTFFKFRNKNHTTTPGTAVFAPTFSRKKAGRLLTNEAQGTWCHPTICR